MKEQLITKQQMLTIMVSMQYNDGFISLEKKNKMINEINKRFGNSKRAG